MSSILTAVFKATIGLLVNKGRDKVAERLEDGDPTDERFRGLIVREINDIKSKLDGLARKDLLASISFFTEGIELLYELFQNLRSESENAQPTTQATAVEPTTKIFSVAKRIPKAELTDLDESSLRVLSSAKKRFKDARREATRAFANEALEFSDRVLAIRYRIMATILETVDNPEDAIAACKVCIEDLHSLSAVKECFTTEFKKGFRVRFDKQERRMMISTVCRVNRVVYDVARMITKRKEHLMLPIVEIEDRKVDPLRDAGVSKVLKKVQMEHCCVTPWSFGEEDEEEQKLKDPFCIATNSDGQFLIGDNGDNTVKVFDDSGNFVFKFHLQSDGAKKIHRIHSVASDVNNNIYVLLSQENTCGLERLEVQVYNSANFVRKFRMRGILDPFLWISSAMIVANNKLFMTNGIKKVHVYELDGRFLYKFGAGTLEADFYISDGPDSQVSILDRFGPFVRVFTEDGHQQHEFKINATRGQIYHHAWHPSGDYVVIAECEWESQKTTLSIYSKDGECKRMFDVEEELRAITLTKEGCIAVIVHCYTFNPFKVIVF